MHMNTFMEKQGVLAHWVDQFGDELYTWAFHKTRDESLAEDLIQDTFLVAFQSLEKFQQRSSPRTWLFSILNNKIIDYYRQQARHSTMSLEAQNDPSDSLFDEDDNWKKESRPAEWDLSHHHLLDDPEFGKIFYACMEHLPASWLSCLQLKYLEAKEGEEICQVLNISPSNFWQILHRAKLQMRVCLEKRWFSIQG